MDILPTLLKKYPFAPEISYIFVGNLFHHLKAHEQQRRVLYIYDSNIMHVVSQYKLQYVISLNLQHPRAHPTVENIAKVIYFIKQYNIEYIYAFGTGAINDICKSVAFLTQIEFTFCPTALSMNGIVSKNASIFDTKTNIKKSIIAKTTNKIILCEEILLNAPKRFIGSSIMDCLAGYTAYNDFIYANRIDSQKYQFESKIFDIFHQKMQEILQIVYNNTSLLYNDFSTIINVFELLYICGCIMNYYGSSIAFSGGEHHIAHTLEAKYPQIGEDFLHGEVISAILPYYANLQNKYQKNDYISAELVNKNNNVNFKEIAQILGIPSAPTELNITREEFLECVKNAKHAKERPTILSLLF